MGTELALSVSDLGYADADGSGNARYEAIASHRGVSVAHGRGMTTFTGMSMERYGYGGWMDHSFFVVESGDVMDGPTLLEGAGLVYGYSVGTAAGSNPTATGGATWSGVMVGMDAMAEGAAVQGDARITIDDFLNPMVDIEFVNVHNLVAGTTYNDMSLDRHGTDARAFPGRHEHEDHPGPVLRSRPSGGRGHVYTRQYSRCFWRQSIERNRMGRRICSANPNPGS